MSSIQRLGPAISGIAQYAFGFGLGSVLGTATYFYINRETVVVGEDSLPMRFRWASRPEEAHAPEAAAAEAHHH